ncbi:MAG: AAA-like domain-containing protein [Lachnospiraceae bacterium]|nr:AAA-like domain-containing protein [Lachnospiraceae bacterium]
MSRRFNISGNCNSAMHYMVNIEERLAAITKLIDDGAYFMINKARQYGKTTTLDLLEKRLRERYAVFYISFEGVAEEAYQNESSFCRMFCGLLYDVIDYGEVRGIPKEFQSKLENMSRSDGLESDFRMVSRLITDMCKAADRPVVLMIDEVDQAGGHRSFLDFLGMLRNKYLMRDKRAAFQAVILTGVYDIRSLKLKIRSENEHQKNSPWNITEKFMINMDFSQKDIADMLKEYEQDHHTGMDTKKLAQFIYEYTSGYPFLVSDICRIMDEEIIENQEFKDLAAIWTKEGFQAAVKMLMLEKNTLFESLVNKLTDYPKLREMMHAILFEGEKISYNPDHPIIDLASMFGFVKNENGIMAVANRIFEMRLYNLFLSEEEIDSRIFSAGSMDKNQFIREGILNMDLVLEKFMMHWGELYGSADDRFVEHYGRKFFLLYLKPIINGIGNFYIESETRDRKRTDVIVDYRGRQYIVEIKIWHGNEYNKRGEIQLADYLETHHVQKGYMLSFNFNKNKVTGLKEIKCRDRIILEAVV